MPHFSPGFTQRVAGFPVQLLIDPLAKAKTFISSSAVFMSGAATYWLGQTGFNACANALMSSIFFCGVISLGSAMMPDFAPPKGKPANAHFQVMVRASFATSSIETDGVILMPPFPGPRAVLSTIRNPRMPTLGLYTSRTFSGPKSSKVTTSYHPFDNVDVLYYL